MKLSALCQFLKLGGSLRSTVSFDDLHHDSRKVQPGTLFLALSGKTHEGRDYVDAAIAKGAVGVLVDGTKEHFVESPVPIVTVPHLKDRLSEIAAWCYPEAKKMKLVAVTGTNGKTSIVNWVAQVFAHVNDRCGTIGTLGIGIPPDWESGDLTTPQGVDVYRALSHFKRQGVDRVALEASSIALEQHRLQGLSFSTAVFTNFTPDHLDYHGDMDAYWKAKQSLFTTFSLENAVLNFDDPKSKQLEKVLPANVRIVGYHTGTPLNRDDRILEVCLLKHHLHSKGITATVSTPWGKAELQLPVLGGFNLSNCLAVLSVACLEGFSLEVVAEALRQLKPVPGRMALLPKRCHQPQVIVDYAHTPDALNHLLKAVRLQCEGLVWCVFGCGGNRDRAKRPLMLEAVQKEASRVIVTADNPRDEDLNQIFSDIFQQAPPPFGVQVIADRKSAIKTAILAAASNDVVVIAGKGHENYQCVAGKMIPFSDAHVAESILNSQEPACSI